MSSGTAQFYEALKRESRLKKRVKLAEIQNKNEMIKKDAIEGNPTPVEENRQVQKDAPADDEKTKQIDPKKLTARLPKRYNVCNF